MYTGIAYRLKKIDEFSMTRFSLKCRNIYICDARIKNKNRRKSKRYGKSLILLRGEHFFTWGVALKLHTLKAVHFLHNGNLPLKNGKKCTYRQTKKVTNGKYLPEIFWKFTIFGNIFEISHGKVQLSFSSTQ
jgi:hypothetical protein